MRVLILVSVACRSASGPQSDGSSPASEPGLQIGCAETDNVLRYACDVTVSPPGPVEVVAEAVDGSLPPVRLVSDAVAAEHAVLVRYLAHETTYVVRAAALSDPGLTASVTLTTGTLGPELGAWLEVTGEPATPWVGSNHPCGEQPVAVIFDTATGKMVWYERLSPDGAFTMSNLVRFTPERTVFGESGTRLVEVDPTGAVLFEMVDGVDYFEDIHHDFFPAGDYLYLLLKPADSRVLPAQFDSVGVVDRRTGDFVRRWDSWTTLPIPDPAVGNVYHINSIYVDDERAMYLSLFEQSTLAKLDGLVTSDTFGETVWLVAGSEADPLGGGFTVDWSAVPGEGFWFQQHNLSAYDDGRILFLDNHHGRALTLTVDGDEQVARVESAHQALSPFCGGQGTAMPAPNGNLFVGCRVGPVAEYDAATSELIWSGNPACPAGEPLRNPRWYPLERWTD